MRRIGAIASVLVLFATCLNAQTFEAKNLKGIKTVTIAIDGLSTPQCGLSQADVKTSVKYVVGQSAVNIVDTYLPTVLSVNLILMDDCSASFVALQLYTPATVDETGTLDPTATIWHNGALMTGPNQRQRILDKIEEFSKVFVVDWNSVNKQTAQ